MKNLYITGDAGSYQLFRSTIRAKGEQRRTTSSRRPPPTTEIAGKNGETMVKVADISDEEAAALASSTMVALATKRPMTVSRKRNANPVVSLRIDVSGHPVVMVDLPATETRPKPISLPVRFNDDLEYEIWLKPVAARQFLVTTGITDRRDEPAVERFA